MLPDYIVFIGRAALYTTLYMGAPFLLVALFAGLAVGIIQAATSINEMTLSFIPKLLCVLLVMVLLGNFILGKGINLMQGVFEEIQHINHQQI